MGKYFEGLRLGIFIFIGSALLMVAVFLIGSKKSLFDHTITVKSYFTSVEGLKNGAPVRLSGTDIGSVTDITMAGDTTGRVIVSMQIKDEVRQFIRLDSECYIETEGVVGQKLVDITPGSPQFEVVHNGSIIRTRPTFSLTKIMSEAQEAIEYTKIITRDFASIVSKVNSGQGTIGKLINDETLYRRAVSLTGSADRSLNQVSTKMNDVTSNITGLSGGVQSLLVNVDSTVTGVRRIIKNIDQGKGTLGALLNDRSAYDGTKKAIEGLINTAEEARRGVAAFSENMEALKHNFLFKGYFEKRGYWNRDEFEKQIDGKISQLKGEQLKLDERIKELKGLEKRR